MKLLQGRDGRPSGALFSSAAVSELRVFVYGTLKKGFSNHDAYCAGVLRISPAWLYGRLFKLSPEIPVMTVPEESILAVGTAVAADDIEIQQMLKSGLRVQTREASDGLAWKKIRGELLLFEDPESRLPLLDGLENFCPGDISTYLRVLAPINLPGGLRTTAWTYIAASWPQTLEEFDGDTWL